LSHVADPPSVVMSAISTPLVDERGNCSLCCFAGGCVLRLYTVTGYCEIMSSLGRIAGGGIFRPFRLSGSLILVRMSSVHSFWSSRIRWDSLDFAISGQVQTSQRPDFQYARRGRRDNKLSRRIVDMSISIIFSWCMLMM
jgi:hypothetical protein